MKKIIILVFLFIYTQFSYAQENTLLNISENIKYYHTIQYNPNYNSSDTIYVIDTVYVEILPEVKEKRRKVKSTWIMNFNNNYVYGQGYSYYNYYYPYYYSYYGWGYSYYSYSYYNYYYPYYYGYYGYYPFYPLSRYYPYTDHWANRNNKYYSKKNSVKTKTSPRISRSQYKNRNVISRQNNKMIEKRDSPTMQKRSRNSSSIRMATKQRSLNNPQRYTNYSTRSTKRVNTVQRETTINTRPKSYTPIRSNTQRRSYTPNRSLSPSRSTRPPGNSLNSRSKTNRRH